MTINDRYSKAITTSNLKVEARIAHDADVLIAAGWTANPERKLDASRYRQHRKPDSVQSTSLASLLYRLRIEFDRIDKHALRVSQTNTRFVGPPTLRQQQRPVTEMLSAFTKLSAYAETKRALTRFVFSTAARANVTLSDAQLASVAERLLDHYLDPVCDKCRGICYVVIPGAPTHLSTTPCSTCNATGRKLFTDLNAKEYDFLRTLSDELQRKLDRMSDVMRHYLRSR